MRLSGLLAPLLLGFVTVLPGCAYVGNPFDGFGMFIGDTHVFQRGPNSPIGDSPNMRRVTGREIDVPPLTPEPGNVWPGPQPPDPTLEDLERQQNGGASNGQGGYYSSATNPPPGTPDPGQRPITRGSSTSPDLLTQPQGAPPPPTPRVPALRPPSQSPPPIRAIPTPQGPAYANPSGGGVQTYTVPGGGVGILVPNGNGTNTLIGPDGGVTTAPQQR